MSTEFRFKRSKTSFLCKANKLRENYGAEVFVVIKRNQRCAVYSSAPNSSWRTTLDAIKASELVDETWCPENIHLLEPKKRNDPDGSLEAAILEPPSSWETGNMTLVTDKLWGGRENLGSSLFALKRHNNTSSSIKKELRANAKDNTVQKMPNMSWERAIEGPNGLMSFYSRSADSPEALNEDGLDSSGEIERVEDRSPDAKISHPPGPTRQNDAQNSFLDFGYNRSSAQSQAPTHSLTKRSAQTPGRHSKPFKPVFSSLPLGWEGIGNSPEPHDVVLGSLCMEPPRFKAEDLQRHKRKRRIDA
ncbi:hypothetical protein AOL_s00091g59 [Orbilia oligospora ATCC 24927]|uniref:MADS-box domain-containing protein n=1 Tax=Arthrobotrys oligospora (strain ATCC 24927 / CBS 115.81 / DSM 1491) TaxID=756982 RepID=G1XI07_ARTOA|nr:hypothetical protein AOL_s00091g59 [Orbilia oligospora ATCC 24927]EGX47238.1 hypothetical protein AOL_s00091g59 [Orbilia oligospora ATCC 24927]